MLDDLFGLFHRLVFHVVAFKLDSIDLLLNTLVYYSVKKINTIQTFRFNASPAYSYYSQVVYHHTNICATPNLLLPLNSFQITVIGILVAGPKSHFYRAVVELEMVIKGPTL